MGDKLHHVQSQLDILIAFLDEHESTMRSHLNDFFCEPPPKITDHHATSFRESCCAVARMGCCFESTYGATCHKYCCRDDLKQENNNGGAVGQKTATTGNTYLSVKKHHEIDVMSSSVLKMVHQTRCANVVDIGSGKGYLGQRLIQQHRGCRVLGIEGSSSCSESAHNRQMKMDKLQKSGCEANCDIDSSCENENSMKTVTHEINSATIDASQSFVELIKTSFGEGSDLTSVNNQDDTNEIDIGVSNEVRSGGVVLVGLHACGDLTVNTLKLFTKVKFFRAVQIVGCCYNLCTEKPHIKDRPPSSHGTCHNFNNMNEPMYGFPLSSHVTSKSVHLGQIARQLACQSPEKWLGSQQTLQQSLLYRAIIQKMASDHLSDVSVLSKVKFRNIGKRSNSFFDYLNRAYKYLDASDVALLTSVAEEYHERYACRWEEMKAFHWRRMQLAPCIEKLILLDRLCYLLECGFVDMTVVKMFDTRLSPRCFAIVGERSLNECK